MYHVLATRNVIWSDPAELFAGSFETRDAAWLAARDIFLDILDPTERGPWSTPTTASTFEADFRRYSEYRLMDYGLDVLDDAERAAYERDMAAERAA